jgi:hypothetical protein
MLVTDKKTGETFLYSPPDSSGFSMCAKVGHIVCDSLAIREWNAKGELIKTIPHANPFGASGVYF